MSHSAYYAAQAERWEAEGKPLLAADCRKIAERMAREERMTKTAKTRETTR